MQNIRYHITNITAIVLFSFITAITISQFIRLSISRTYSISVENDKFAVSKAVKKSYDEYKTILDSNFFRLANESTSTADSGVSVSSSLSEFQLLGTITGPASIARALLKKRGEKEAAIFKLGNDVYGYKLVRIDNSKIFLKSGNTTDILEMYTKEEKNQQTAHTDPSKTFGQKNSQSISKSEIQQKLLNNIDNALEGLRAGPYKVNDRIEGYKLFRVSPNNFLYKLGARSGDIAKRINGHPIDSTEKLLGIWQSVQGESKITIDIDRGGKLQTFELNVTD